MVAYYKLPSSQMPRTWRRVDVSATSFVLLWLKTASLKSLQQSRFVSTKWVGSWNETIQQSIKPLSAIAVLLLLSHHKVIDPQLDPPAPPMCRYVAHTARAKVAQLTNLNQYSSHHKINITKIITCNELYVYMYVCATRYTRVSLREGAGSQTSVEG